MPAAALIPAIIISAIAFLSNRKDL